MQYENNTESLTTAKDKKKTMQKLIISYCTKYAVWERHAENKHASLENNKELLDSSNESVDNHENVNALIEIEKWIKYNWKCAWCKWYENEWVR